MTTKTTTLSAFIAYLLIGSSVIIPFIFLNQAIDPTISIRFTILSISLLVLTLFLNYSILRKTQVWDFSILRRFLFPVLILYLGISAISLLKAINFQEGVFELLKIGLFVISIIFSGVIFFNVPLSISILIRAIIITAGVSAVIGILQYYGVAFNSIPGNYVIYGTMTNKNLFASFLFLTLPYSLYGFFQLKNPWDSIGAIASILSLWCIFLAASRAVWLALLVSVCCVGIISWIIYRRFKIGKREKIQYVSKLIILVVAVFSLNTLSYFSGQNITNEPLKGKIVSAANLSEGSKQVRFQLWGKTLDMISDHPILGVGIGNWKINIPKYGMKDLPSENGKVQYIRPHNDFLWIWAETGTLGFLSYFTIFIICIYYLFKILKRSRTLSDNFFLLMMLFGITGFLVISLISFPKERVAHLIFFNILVAVTLVEYHKIFRLKKKFSIPILPILIASIIILGFSLFIGYQKIQSEKHLKGAYDFWAANQWNKMLTESKKAQTLFIGLDSNASPTYWIQGVANMSLGKKEAALDNLKKAATSHPYHIQILDNLATCYELLGDHSNAVKYYKQVLEISPQYENSLSNLSVIYYKMGRFKDALQILSQTNFYSGNQKLFQYLEIFKNKLDANN